MEFAILGPLTVVDHGRDVTPGRAKQLALLAALLLQPNEVVAGDRLVEALWGEAPPATAANALHGHVSALRKLLGPKRIETQRTGYLLRLDPDELDLARFEALVAEARRQDEPAARAGCLREALALWRGDPLADLSYESFAQPEIGRLAELRLAALEDRVEADLVLGRHAELVGELESLVVEHPYRERLRGQLMLALYRCGRQADALHVFQQGRRALVEELGIEPGPALQRLQGQILSQDSSLELGPRERLNAGTAATPDATGSLDRDRFELREERKLATILVAEVGCTALGRTLDPERRRALMRSYWGVMSDAVAGWGGTLERYAGDAVMAVFGVPAVREDDADRALHAALEMLERLELVDRSFAERHGVTFAIRIGVNTGDVIASWGERNSQPLVAGDAVNVAATLAKAADAGTVLVGHRTYVLARRALAFGGPVALDPSGDGGRLIARSLERALPAAAPPPAVDAAFVGRERELSQLSGLLEEAVETGTARLVLVYGAAGIGKTRLTREFLACARERHPHITLLKGRCLAAGRGITYWALGEVLRESLGITLDDPADTATRRLRTGARAILSSLELPEEELERTVSALAATAGIALADDPFDRMEPRTLAEELVRAWVRFATALALRRPTVLLIEDLHWASEPLLAMLDRIATRVTGPLLVAATARPEAQPGFMTGREGATSITLGPLNESEATALIAALLPSAELPPELHEQILGMAEGNPFFLEEVVLRLVDAGAIVRHRDRWQVAADAASISLPDSVQGLLAARIDSLSWAEKRVLQEAAVVGRVFWQAPLVRALGDATVSDALSRLEDRGLVTARPTSALGGQTEFQFRHALLRDVAYGGLPKARRARAHAELAAWIEDLAGERLDELIELVAHHYGSAVAGEDADLAWAEDAHGYASVRARALEALLSAGYAARRRFAISKALELHHQALALVADDRERARALAAIGDDHEAGYHGDEAFEAYLAALDLLREQQGSESLRAHVYFMASRMAAVKWGAFRIRPTPALIERLVDDGLTVATDDEMRNWLTVLKGTVGLRWLWSRSKDPLPLAERIRAAEEGVELAERMDSPALLSQAYRALGLLQSLAGRWDETVEIARRDLELADRLERTAQAFALFWNAIFLMEITGAYVDHLPHAERSLEVARALTPHERMHGTYTVMSARFHLGRWTDLERLGQQHVEALAQEPGITCPYCRGGPAVAALALAHQGRFDRAAELAAALEPDLDKPGLPEALLARYLVARGDPQAGKELAERIVGRAVYAEENAFEILALLDALTALERWDTIADVLAEARRWSNALALIGPVSDRAEGLARAAAGDRSAAEHHLRQALLAFRRINTVFEQALTKEHLATVVPDSDASRLRSEALATYQHLQATPHIERIRATLSTPAGRP